MSTKSRGSHNHNSNYSVCHEFTRHMRDLCGGVKSKRKKNILGFWTRRFNIKRLSLHKSLHIQYNHNQNTSQILRKKW